MSLVQLPDAQARVSDSVTQNMIDEAEAWLMARIGPLKGELTETFFDPKLSVDGIIDAVYLSRRTNEVTGFTSDGGSLVLDTDWRLVKGHIIERIGTGAAWSFPLVATYTPNDEVLVRSVVLDLLQYRVNTPPGLQSVKIGDYSETYSVGASARRSVFQGALLSRILPAANLGAYATPFRINRHSRDRTLLEATGS